MLCKGSNLASTIFSCYNSGNNRLYASYLSVADSAYILRKDFPRNKLMDSLKEFCRECCILPMNDMQIYDAMDCKSPDFEDRLFQTTP